MSTLTINNFIIIDFNNPQVASATNFSAFRYYYNKYMLYICPEKNILIEVYRLNI